MAGLLDIAPAVEAVEIRGNAVDVYGVSVKGIAYLLQRFPELRMMMSGKSVDPEALLAVGGDAVAAIIAAGTGYPGDKQAEEIAGKLALDEQADLLAAIVKLTMPGGIGPFVQKLNGLGLVLSAEGEASGGAQATKSRKPSKA